MNNRLALLALALCSCASNHQQRPAEGSQAEEPVEDAGADTLDWSRTTPLEFLEFLASTERSLFTVNISPPQDWYDDQQLEGLVAQLGSEEPATPVVSVYSSYLPFEEQPDGTRRMQVSTVGREAAFLIAGYREGTYPPTISSLTHFRPDREGTVRWWAAR